MQATARGRPGPVAPTASICIHQERSGRPLVLLFTRFVSLTIDLSDIDSKSLQDFQNNSQILINPKVMSEVCHILIPDTTSLSTGSE